MSESVDVRNWLFRALMFEADSEVFRDAGLRIGSDQSSIEQRVFESSLTAFPISLRNSALRMARLYALLHCFENSVRDLVKGRLEVEYKSQWWEEGVSKTIRDRAESRKRDAVQNSWLQAESSELLSFVDFGDLCQTIVNKWDLFSDLLPSQHWLKQRFDEMEKARNFVAHNRELSSSEFGRLELYVADWNAQVGV